MKDVNFLDEEEKAKFQAMMERSYKVVGDIMHKAMIELEKADVSSGVVVTYLMDLAAYTSRDNDNGASFLRLMGKAAKVAIGSEVDDDGDDDTDTGTIDLEAQSKMLIEGLIITARVNAGANGVSPAAMVPLMIQAACELAKSEDRFEYFIDIIGKMVSVANDILSRGRDATKH